MKYIIQIASLLLFSSLLFNVSAQTYQKQRDSILNYTNSVQFRSPAFPAHSIYLAPAKALSPINYYINSDLNTIQAPTKYDRIPANVTAICKDGSYSFSRHRSGTCSGHGGVKKWIE